MNHREIDPDEVIDRLLTGLRDVEPPQGMQRRILDAATEHFATRRVWNLALPFTPAKSWTLAVTSVAIVALGITWIVPRDLHHVNQRADTRRHDTAAGSARPTHVSDTESLQSQPVRHSVRATQRQTVAAVESLSTEDALAVSEMNAPSRPAPPLPLTRQEKLLAEAVHQAGAKELASLRPEVRVRQMELSKAEFHDFFEPPAAKDNE